MNKRFNKDPRSGNATGKVEPGQSRRCSVTQGEGETVRKEQKRLRRSRSESPSALTCNLPMSLMHETAGSGFNEVANSWTQSTSETAKNSSTPGPPFALEAECEDGKEETVSKMTWKSSSTVVDTDLRIAPSHQMETSMTLTQYENTLPTQSSVINVSIPQTIQHQQNQGKDGISLQHHDINPSVDNEQENIGTITSDGAARSHPLSVHQYPGIQPRTGESMTASQMLSMPPPATSLAAAHLFAMAAVVGMATVQQLQPAGASFMTQTTPPSLLGITNGQPQLNATLDGTEDHKQGPLLYMSMDDDVLSENQIVLRKQIEFFEASLDDVGRTTSGRRHPILPHQVGIQCRHCSSIPARYRQRGAVYYPARLTGIYQAAQNMAVTHLANLCQYIDSETKARLQSYQQGRAATGHGGKQYWADSAKAQGIIESEEGGLRFSML